MNKEKKLETLLVIVLGLAVACWITKKDFLLALAVIIGIAGLLVPAVAYGIHWCWTRLSEGLGWVSGKILLATVYVLILIPLSVLAKRFGKLTMNGGTGSGSRFKERNHRYQKEDLENLW